MMTILETFEAKLRKDPKSIVFPEGSDARVLEAVSRLLASNFLFPILIGKEAEIYAAAEEAGYNIRGAKIIDPQNYERFDEMVDLFVKIRAHKNMTEDKARVVLLHPNYFGCMLVKMGEADSMLSGATYAANDTLLPALQILKKEGDNHTVSGCYILDRANATGENTRLVMGDCAINVNPTEDQLVEICGDIIRCAKKFHLEPKVAFLSYSTNGSGKGESVDKMHNAAAKAKAAYPTELIEGEMQMDAAVSPNVAQLKYPNSKVAGYANTFLFPDVQSANIGYKIAARMGNFNVYGPILLGLNGKVSGLSRSCNGQEVYIMAVCTAAGAGIEWE